MMKSGINLLPYGYRRRELLRGLAVRWAMVWIVSAATLVAATWLGKAWLHNSLERSAAAERAYRPLAKLLYESEAARKELRDLDAKGALLGQLSEKKPVLVLIGTASANARKCGGRLVIRDLLFERSDRVKKAQPAKGRSKKRKDPTPAPQTGGWATVTFRGDALDNLAVATFAAGLRDSGLFRRVELVSSLGTRDADAATHAFTLKCEI